MQESYLDLYLKYFIGGHAECSGGFFGFANSRRGVCDDWGLSDWDAIGNRQPRI